MGDDEKLSRFIGNVYDAALDPALWIGVLEQIARFVGGPAASLYSKDVVSKTGSVAYDWGIKAQYKQLYFDKYIKLDPTTTSHFFAEIEVPVDTADLIPYDEFFETRFYKEWARPQGIVGCLNATLDKSATSFAVLGVFRSEREGLADGERRRRMRLIVPHVRRAALIGRVIELKKAEAATFADTLDGISAGMFLVDGAGRIVHANVAGHAMLSKADILRAANGRLSACNLQTDQTLADIFATASNGDAAIGLKGIALPLAAGDGEHHVCHVLPLTSGARRRAGTNYAAVAALFVRKAALATPSIPEAIAKAYKLTPTELRVLLAIVEIGGVPEVADALGVSTETVKTHLGRVYTKTGARRQVDLAKITLAFVQP
jgi:DNA-binding CsgD family transcriptional regulator/PAS domain-containing protein